MFNKRTLIVVGAGASREVNIPTGDELKNTIAEIANIGFQHGYKMISGDEMIYEAIYKLKNNNPNIDINSYFQAGRIIHDAMPQAISIDNFIDSHRGNKEIETMGKLSIVKAILGAERNCNLFFDRSYHSKMNFDGVKSTWFNSFMKLLTENCQIEQIEERLSKIQFVIFNYDRCIEHYMYHSLQNYYRISESQAASIVKNMKIYHPYGTVGNLPWHSNKNVIEFGGEPHSAQLLELSNGIKTFTESNEPKAEDISKVHEEISSANILLFLGFAYHRQNLKLIYPPALAMGKKIDGLVNYYGTAKGTSLNDSMEIQAELSELGGVDKKYIKIDNISCFELFRDYWRSLSLS